MGVGGRRASPPHLLMVWRRYVVGGGGVEERRKNSGWEIKAGEYIGMRNFLLWKILQLDLVKSTQLFTSPSLHNHSSFPSVFFFFSTTIIRITIHSPNEVVFVVLCLLFSLVPSKEIITIHSPNEVLFAVSREEPHPKYKLCGFPPDNKDQFKDPNLMGLLGTP